MLRVAAADANVRKMRLCTERPVPDDVCRPSIDGEVLR
jgi:hypothetical protein